MRLLGFVVLLAACGTDRDWSAACADTGSSFVYAGSHERIVPILCSPDSPRLDNPADPR